MLTKQVIFNRVFDHFFVKGNGPCGEGSGYYSSGGNHCPVGLFLDEKLCAELDDGPFQGQIQSILSISSDFLKEEDFHILNAIKKNIRKQLGEDNLDIFHDLQKWHDYAAERIIGLDISKLIDIGKKYNLDVSKAEEYVGI